MDENKTQGLGNVANRQYRLDVPTACTDVFAIEKQRQGPQMRMVRLGHRWSDKPALMKSVC